MKIELEIDDLKTTIDGLNNAIIAYNDFIRMPIFFNLEKDKLDPKWHPLVEEEKSLERTSKIDKRLKSLKSLYEQLVSLE